jgi:dihydroorotate dehydrogenase
MGFNNEGAKAAAERVRSYRQKHKSSMIIGGNIGKNKITPNEEAWKDYEICFNELHDVVDYFVVNVSSPNTPGLRDLQQKDSLKKILTNLQEINKTKKNPKPLLLKISPDLNQNDLDDIIDLALEINLDGLVAANTTISRNNLITHKKTVETIGAGGLSGKPLNEESNRITKYIYSKTNGKIPIISSGGIFSANDAKEKFAKGASLIQVWTGFIYEGPGIVKKILSL